MHTRQTGREANRQTDRQIDLKQNSLGLLGLTPEERQLGGTALL